MYFLAVCAFAVLFGVCGLIFMLIVDGGRAKTDNDVSR
jgi:hypothetical protein